METVMFILKLVAYFAFGAGLAHLGRGTTFDKFLMVMGLVYIIAEIIRGIF